MNRHFRSGGCATVRDLRPVFEPDLSFTSPGGYGLNERKAYGGDRLFLTNLHRWWVAGRLSLLFWSHDTNGPNPHNEFRDKWLVLEKTRGLPEL